MSTFTWFWTVWFKSWYFKTIWSQWLGQTCIMLHRYIFKLYKINLKFEPINLEPYNLAWMRVLSYILPCFIEIWTFSPVWVNMMKKRWKKLHFQISGSVANCWNSFHFPHMLVLFSCPWNCHLLMITLIFNSNLDFFC